MLPYVGGNYRLYSRKPIFEDKLGNSIGNAFGALIRHTSGGVKAYG